MARIAKLGNLLRRRARRFKSEDDGVTIIEFALLAFPFFALMGAILETGLYLFASQVFDSAVDDASRTILVGSATNSQSDFRNKICETTFGLIECDRIKIRIRPIASFSAANPTPPVDADGNWVLTEQMNAGSPRQVMLVEAYYKWSTFLSFDYGFQKYGNTVLLSSARVFMNEPGAG